MVYTTDKNFILELPKVDKCKLDRKCIYMFIIQNTFTKDIWLYRVRDWNILNPLRFQFKMCFQENMPKGEYEYYLVSDEHWQYGELDVNNVRKTQVITDKSFLKLGNHFLLANNKLLVINSFKEVVTKDGYPVLIGKDLGLKTIKKSKDKRSEGELYRSLSIISSGLIKYEPKHLFKDESIKEFDYQPIYKEFQE